MIERPIGRSLDAIVRLFRGILAGYMRRLPTYPALLGDGYGTIKVTGWSGWVWVRVGSDERLERAFNQRVPLCDNRAIIVGYDSLQPTLFQVLSLRDDAYAGGGTGQPTTPQVVSHHKTHEFPTVDDSALDGSDTTYIHWRQIRGLRVYIVSGFTIGIERWPIRRGGTNVWIATQQINLEPDKPAAGARYVTAYLDADGVFQRRLGSIVATGSITIADAPLTVAGEWELGNVLLYTTQTGLRDDGVRQDIIDRRFPATYAAAVSDHNDLGAIQGGAVDEYYHMTAAQHTAFTETVEDITKTVKAAAGDFTTIQAAVDWFKGRVVLGACKIEVDAAAYDEAVVFEDLLIVPGSTLTLEGDTRVLAGLSYVVGSMANRAGLSSGGTFNNANRCTLTVNAAGDEIVVAGGTADPDFDDVTDGVWGDGDHILVFGDDEVIYEHEINAIIGADNTIELKVALDAAAFPGGGGALSDGSAICLMPDCEIDRTVAGPCIDVFGTRGLNVDGFYLETHTGAACHGVRVQAGGMATLNNIAFNGEDYGIYAEARYSIAYSFGGATSVWGGAGGVFANNAAQAVTWYGVAVSCTDGFRAGSFSLMGAQQCIASHCGYAGFRARLYGFVSASLSGARQNNIGYNSALAAYLYANNTIANNNGNAADYAPDPGGVGSAQDANFATLYSS